MCVSPTILKPRGFFYPGSEPVLIPCRVCWQCLSNRVQEWTGRNLAEAATSTVSYAVTMTYGRSWDGRADHIQSVQLMYSDVQKMLMRMRKRNYHVRFIIAGEYGASLQRAHWHGIFHFAARAFVKRKGIEKWMDFNLPEWEGEHLNWTQDHWDRVGGIHIPEWGIWNKQAKAYDYIGHCHIKKATYAHTAYALKYLMKTQNDPYAHVLFNMSRFPPLGTEYMVGLAREAAHNGLAIPDMRYHFDVKTRSGEEKRMAFLLRGRLAEIYLQTYIDTWRALYGNSRWPDSEPVDIFANWGRLGNEDMLTYMKHEGPNAVPFNVSGRPSVFDPPKQRKRTLAQWTRERDEEYRRQRARERNEAKRNGKGFKERQRQQQRDERQRREYEACRILAITSEQFKQFPRAWREFAVASPRDCKSLFDANRKDWERGPAGKPRRLWG